MVKKKMSGKGQRLNLTQIAIKVAETTTELHGLIRYVRKLEEVVELVRKGDEEKFERLIQLINKHDILVENDHKILQDMKNRDLWLKSTFSFVVKIVSFIATVVAILYYIIAVMRL